MELPDASWSTSVCMWYEFYWDVLVDLWTEEEGPSDLVLKVEIYEQGDRFRYRLQLVYVP